jgi:hypothetical protein
MTDANELADRYVAMCTEADAARRRSAIAERWTEDAVHILEPPQEAREAAARRRRGQVQVGDGPGERREAVAVGLEFLILAPDGRIRLDYQFIER